MTITACPNIMDQQIANMGQPPHPPAERHLQENSCPLLFYLCMLSRKTPHMLMGNMNQDFMQDFQRVLQREMGVKGLTIFVSYRDKEDKTYYKELKLKNLVMAADQFTFNMKQRHGEPKQITIAQYYNEKLPNPLQYGFLPCVSISNRAGGTAFPLELCFVAYQSAPLKGALQEAAVREMGSIRPQDRMRHIQDHVNKHYSNENNPDLPFVLTSPTNVIGKARVLPAPVLEQSKNGQAIGIKLGREGKWNGFNNQFYRPAQLLNWVAINFTGSDQDEQDMERAINACQNKMREMGMNVGNPTFYRFRHQSRELDLHDNIKTTLSQAVQNGLRSAQQEQGPPLQFALIFLNSDRCPEYNTVKMCELTAESRFVTQCLHAERDRRGNAKKGIGTNATYWFNIVVKINNKMGGINWKIGGFPNTIPGINEGEKIMVMGVDITRGGQGEKRESVAGVVATINEDLTEYSHQAHMLGERQEKVENMDVLCEPIFEDFYKKNQGMMDVLLVYRDGLSESQLDEYSQMEISGIRKAHDSVCKQHGVECHQLKIVYVSVEKKHHTRFIPIDASQGDQTGNAFPGTVMDQDIISTGRQEFFLQSQGALQGTSRPQRYHVLVNEQQMTKNQLSQFSYWLCYGLGNCPKSISQPAPIRWAHRRAERADKMIMEGCDPREINKPELRNQLYF
eukprot:TRINITY_DN9491_c0_g1_i10.p1 TRINITY_DN9491_c0_g1~~TRINITY_DN9491_c0_g1_i10.p1  ORF type:complete len:753 (-),score=106.21 TRINITY_DN9491_c0_g1_i10:409-2448(-)